MQRTADELESIVDEVAARLRAISDTAAAIKARPESWSIKEIVGHLIDSATNNHQRLIRAQQTDMLVFPGYDQDAWIRLNGYQDRPWPELVELWTLCNRHLAHVIRIMPEAVLSTPCRIGTGDAVTSRFLVDDYVHHLRHHLQQIEERTIA